MRTKVLYLLVSVLVSLPVSAQAVAEVSSASGQKHVIAGRDRTRGDNEIVIYTPEYYKKSPTFKNGIDALILNGKVSAIHDRAGAVYLQNKADPGPLTVGAGGVILSANGDARKWVLANLPLGSTVVITEVGARRDSMAEIPPAPSIPCFAGAYYRKTVTSFDVWTGIAGIVKLGTPRVDEDRLDPVK
ncbi:MAG TPA: hypothetical protein VNA17_09810, partial [Pyrinomonadaceae bacterium]|nr:hypothetical protein [Pyrinomonadaceae bacterium]